MALTEIAETVQVQVIDAIKSAQDLVVDAVRNWSDAVERVLPAQPRQQLAAQLPRATELVDRSYGFAGKVLESQHEFARRLIEAASPQAPAPARKTSPRRAAAATDVAA
jgi:hypothetical protein